MQTPGTRTFYLLFTLLTAAPALADVQLENAWVRLSPPGAPSMAGYGTVVNGGDEAVTIRDVRADGFRMSMLHSTIIENGMSKMRHLDEIELGPGQRFGFVPGGAHIMLMGPETRSAEGDVLVIELQIDGTWHPYEFPVRRD